MKSCSVITQASESGCTARNQLLLTLWRTDERKSSGQYAWAHVANVSKLSPGLTDWDRFQVRFHPRPCAQITAGHGALIDIARIRKTTAILREVTFTISRVTLRKKKTAGCWITRDHSS
jgi:hypothetical protein